MKIHNAAGPVATVLALLIAAPAPAEIYKWTDEDGNVVYSEKAPVGQETETVKPRDTKPAAAPSPVRRGARTASENYEYSPDESDELSPAQLARKQQNCENAKSQVAQMNSARANRLQYVNENNELAFLTEEQRTERSTQAQSKVDEYCN